MKKNNSKIKKISAFSLIELSIVILIISILAAGAISVSTVALTNAKTKVTNERIAAIYNAIGTFVAQNYRLPCPASLTLTRGDAGYGSEQGGNRCSDSSDGIYSSLTSSELVYGMVPVAALNLPDEMGEDGFGTKIAYAVNLNFTAADYPDATDNGGFSFFSDLGDDVIALYQLPSTNEINGMAFAIISHGANKYGGFNADSTVQNSVALADTFEATNALSNVTDNAAPTIDTADFGDFAAASAEVAFVPVNSDSDVFDDIVLAKSRQQIIQDFNLGFLLPCTSVTNGYDLDAAVANAYAGTVSYGAVDCTQPENTRPSQKCGPIANSWIDSVGCVIY